MDILWFSLENFLFSSVLRSTVCLCVHDVRSLDEAFQVQFSRDEIFGLLLGREIFASLLVMGRIPGGGSSCNVCNLVVSHSPCW